MLGPFQIKLNTSPLIKSLLYFNDIFQFVDGTTKQRLVEAYYSLDGVLCREILGKKLSSRLRKELVKKPICVRLPNGPVFR
jgi:hypothetical protein